jgi:hypothetical protein
VERRLAYVGNVSISSSTSNSNARALYTRLSKAQCPNINTVPAATLQGARLIPNSYSERVLGHMGSLKSGISPYCYSNLEKMFSQHPKYKATPTFQVTHEATLRASDSSPSQMSPSTCQSRHMRGIHILFLKHTGGWGDRSLHLE